MCNGKVRVPYAKVDFHSNQSPPLVLRSSLPLSKPLDSSFLVGARHSTHACVRFGDIMGTILCPYYALYIVFSIIQAIKEEMSFALYFQLIQVIKEEQIARWNFLFFVLRHIHLGFELRKCSRFFFLSEHCHFD
ncbi:hypothetical protein KP509_1Z309500 [Ceratopteris richardii]|nr:hypothetical protein KP509_1Z309500 [Ceratopteris richardii]